MAAVLCRGVAGLLSRLQTSAPTVRTLSSSKSSSQNIPSCLWKLGRLNHVAIAVPDLEKAQSFYKNVLGAQERKVPLQASCKKTRLEECIISALRLVVVCRKNCSEFGIFMNRTAADGLMT
ncbi:PREDICTED: methylmalonyl-CoA epimerase, mitochondrial isoform X2 [Sturnus vulgaris]|uniref:methylmalonyl-CoA epimerase, mitochondrial isoform X2 n=1 Tax=Sturnus vulgaris TaxID=9172 RepID=UPI00071A8AB5|nr:PREDICTED: methylmalonyl-CoA epimerase, mitochondrial isoform X2 [Sturnus vulgaris]